MRCLTNTTWCVSFTWVWEPVVVLSSEIAYRELGNCLPSSYLPLLSMITRKVVRRNRGKWKRASPLVRCSIGCRLWRDSNIRHDQKKYLFDTVLGCLRTCRIGKRSVSHFLHILSIIHADGVTRWTTLRVVVSRLPYRRPAISFYSHVNVPPTL